MPVRERIVFAEVKLECGRLGQEQVAWLDVLRDAGQEVHVWRPRDWTSGGVVDVLPGRETCASAYFGFGVTQTSK